FEDSLNTKFLQLLKDVSPQTKKIAVLSFGPLARGRRDFAVMEAAARSVGVSPVEMHVRDDPKDVERAMAGFAREPNGALIVPPDNRTQKHHAVIVALAAQYRLPAIYYNRLFTDAGGLMSYGTDQIEIYRQAASYVDRI